MAKYGRPAKFDFSGWDKNLTIAENSKKLNISKAYCRIYAHRKNLSFKKAYKQK